LPPVSATLLKLVEKFAACVVNTGGMLLSVLLTPVANFPPLSLITVVHLELRISPQIFEKI
jgi:hypothetical protein